MLHVSIIARRMEMAVGKVSIRWHVFSTCRIIQEQLRTPHYWTLARTVLSRAIDLICSWMTHFEINNVCYSHSYKIVGYGSFFIILAIPTRENIVVISTTCSFFRVRSRLIQKHCRQIFTLLSDNSGGVWWSATASLRLSLETTTSAGEHLCHLRGLFPLPKFVPSMLFAIHFKSRKEVHNGSRYVAHCRTHKWLGWAVTPVLTERTSDQEAFLERESL